MEEIQKTQQHCSCSYIRAKLWMLQLHSKAILIVFCLKIEEIVESKIKFFLKLSFYTLMQTTKGRI